MVSYVIPNFTICVSFTVNLNRRAPFLASLELPFSSLISKGSLYVPPTGFEPKLFRSFCLQLARLQYTSLFPVYKQYTQIGSADHALAVSQYIGLRSRYITRTSKSLLIPNNSKWNFVQLSVTEIFREVISACWATSLNWCCNIHVRSSIKIKNLSKFLTVYVFQSYWIS